MSTASAMGKVLAARWRPLPDTIPATFVPHSSPPRQLLVDVSVIAASDAKTGIQRVVRGILAELTVANQTDFVIRPVFATKKEGYAYIPDGDSSVAAPVQVNAHDIFLGLDLSPSLLPRHQRQLRRWRRQGVFISIMLYDMLPSTNPDWFSARSVRNFRRWLRCVDRHADQLICISNHVRTEFIAWRSKRFCFCSQRPIEFETIRLSGDIEGSVPSDHVNADDEAVLSWATRDRTVLVVGTVEPRKGHVFALGAFERLWAKGEPLQLLFIGKSGWKTEVLQSKIRGHAELGRRLLWVENGSDALLLNLYHICAGVLVPSHAEGFGLPIAEALYNGKKVLARNLPVLDDFDDVRLNCFEDDCPASLSTSVMEWLAAPVDNAHHSLPQPGWRDTARMLLSALPRFPHPDGGRRGQPRTSL